MTSVLSYYGYASLGPTRVPPLPPIIVMTDRADGTKWSLIHDSVTGLVGLSSYPVPTWYAGETWNYDAFEGPRIDDQNNIRLLVRNGYLGYEVVPPTRDVGSNRNPRICTRGDIRGGLSEVFSFEVNDVSWHIPGDVLGYSQILDPVLHFVGVPE